MSLIIVFAFAFLNEYILSGNFFQTNLWGMYIKLKLTINNIIWIDYERIN